NDGDASATGIGTGGTGIAVIGTTGATTAGTGITVVTGTIAAITRATTIAVTGMSRTGMSVGCISAVRPPARCAGSNPAATDAEP
ncbi:hypothetical protein NS228_26640, partial [Methylobacterium indicum]|uniref:hypothetical protein n=1 Tax=Methylobacterium indicum TaxID=1775910 RepID=UPI0007341057